MKQSKAYPPNYKELTDVLGDVSEFKPVFAYGDTIFNPFNREITPDVEYHEQVHSNQQANFTSPEIWYIKYLNDAEFRLAQEIEAYGGQYAFGKERVSQNRLLDAFLDSLAFELSGKAYGSLISFGEARSKIRNYEKLWYN